VNERINTGPDKLVFSRREQIIASSDRKDKDFNFVRATSKATANAMTAFLSCARRSRGILSQANHRRNIFQEFDSTSGLFPQPV